MKKCLILIAIICLSLGIIGGCTTDTNRIAVVSREDGSGTRGAFEDIIGFDSSSDSLPDGATTLSSTGAVITNVAGNKSSIGYISLGSLNDTVKAISINGVAATSANITNETYDLFRPFMVASKKTEQEMSAFEKDFYGFLTSTQAQTIIGEDYISIIAGESYTATYTTGTTRGSDDIITISGSTSVQPLMNELVGKYLELNTGLTSSDIVVSGGGSGTGVSNATSGTSSFGMASRALKSSEEADLATKFTLCSDGIAVVVHKDNTLTNLTIEQLNKIFTGEITTYDELS